MGVCLSSAVKATHPHPHTQAALQSTDSNGACHLCVPSVARLEVLKRALWKGASG